MQQITQVTGVSVEEDKETPSTTLNGHAGEDRINNDPLHATLQSRLNTGQRENPRPEVVCVLPAPVPRESYGTGGIRDGLNGLNGLRSRDLSDIQTEVQEGYVRCASSKDPEKEEQEQRCHSVFLSNEHEGHVRITPREGGGTSQMGSCRSDCSSLSEGFSEENTTPANRDALYKVRGGQDVLLKPHGAQRNGCPGTRGLVQGTSYHARCPHGLVDLLDPVYVHDQDVKEARLCHEKRCFYMEGVPTFRERRNHAKGFLARHIGCLHPLLRALDRELPAQGLVGTAEGSQDFQQCIPCLATMEEYVVKRKLAGDGSMLGIEDVLLEIMSEQTARSPGSPVTGSRRERDENGGKVGSPVLEEPDAPVKGYYYSQDENYRLDLEQAVRASIEDLGPPVAKGRLDEKPQAVVGLPEVVGHDGDRYDAPTAGVEQQAARLKPVENQLIALLPLQLTPHRVILSADREEIQVRSPFSYSQDGEKETLREGGVKGNKMTLLPNGNLDDSSARLTVHCWNLARSVPSGKMKLLGQNGPYLLKEIEARDLVSDIREYGLLPHHLVTRQAVEYIQTLGHQYEVPLVEDLLHFIENEDVKAGREPGARVTSNQTRYPSWESHFFSGQKELNRMFVLWLPQGLRISLEVVNVIDVHDWYQSIPVIVEAGRGQRDEDGTGTTDHQRSIREATYVMVGPAPSSSEEHHEYTCQSGSDVNELEVDAHEVHRIKPSGNEESNSVPSRSEPEASQAANKNTGGTAPHGTSDPRKDSNVGLAGTPLVKPDKVLGTDPHRNDPDGQHQLDADEDLGTRPRKVTAHCAGPFKETREKRDDDDDFSPNPKSINLQVPSPALATTVAMKRPFNCTQQRESGGKRPDTSQKMNILSREQEVEPEGSAITAGPSVSRQYMGRKLRSEKTQTDVRRGLKRPATKAFVERSEVTGSKGDTPSTFVSEHAAYDVTIGSGTRSEVTGNEGDTPPIVPEVDTTFDVQNIVPSTSPVMKPLTGLSSIETMNLSENMNGAHVGPCGYIVGLHLRSLASDLKVPLGPGGDEFILAMVFQPFNVFDLNSPVPYIPVRPEVVPLYLPSLARQLKMEDGMVMVTIRLLQAIYHLFGQTRQEF